MKYLDDTGVARLVEQIKANVKISVTDYVYTTEVAELVSFTVPAYTTDGASTIEVYINRMRAIPAVDFTVTGNVLTLTKELDVGQTVHVVVKRVYISTLEPVVTSTLTTDEGESVYIEEQ